MGRVTEIIQEVADEICERYCKYPDVCLEQIKDADEANDYCLKTYCERCPLGRL